MSATLSRRSFLHATSAAAGGLMVGFHVPGLAQQPAGAPPELNAWVQILPDDTTVIRIARSEMGQGTLTGLAQLVAEELECDWRKVKTEYPTPGQNLARNRAWGSMSTGRQPRRARVARVRAQGRRAGARAADPGGGQPVERGGGGSAPRRPAGSRTRASA